MKDDLIKQLIGRLDVLIKLNIQSYSEENYPYTGLSAEILKLCDYENSRDDIMRKLNKTGKGIDPVITKLRKAGLILSVMKNNKTYYVRLK